MLHRFVNGTPNDDFRASPGHLLRRMYQASTGMFAEACVAFDLTTVQYAALSAIGEQPLIDATRLGQSIYLDRSTLGAVLDRLEGKGLIVRVPSPSDRRIKLLQSTQQGTQLVMQATPVVLAMQARLLEPLTERQREEFLALLLTLSEFHTGPTPFRHVEGPTGTLAPDRERSEELLTLQT